MGLLNLEFSSTPCEGKYGQISISFNNKEIETDLELSVNTTKLTYNVDISTESDNIIKIDLLNGIANGYNSITKKWNEARTAILKSVTYSVDDLNDIRLIPQVDIVYPFKENIIITSDIPSQRMPGSIIILVHKIKEFIVYDYGYELKFNQTGIVDGEFIKLPITWALETMDY